ncbi:hypothetical protein CEXT_19241 [Caerostris extrusa]|uniref:Uncharacterized protein n=1 Tax=Caerostris extrusa TaxID=172846 RepID=A0AAV4XAG5_CAEEX|nr:hypothetical protein CEXT_19241 [Caerostris extrusa]
MITSSSECRRFAKHPVSLSPAGEAGQLSIIIRTRAPSFPNRIIVIPGPGLIARRQLRAQVAMGACDIPKWPCGRDPLLCSVVRNNRNRYGNAAKRIVAISPEPIKPIGWPLLFSICSAFIGTARFGDKAVLFNKGGLIVVPRAHIGHSGDRWVDVVVRHQCLVRQTMSCISSLVKILVNPEILTSLNEN